MPDPETYDLLIVGTAALTLIFVVMLLITRALVASLVIVGTVLLSLGAAFGLSVLVWQNLLGLELNWIAPVFGLIIAIAGTVGYLVNGWGAPGTPPLTLGYIYLPALVLVSGVSMFFAPLGAKLAHRLPVATLKKVFAGVLMLLCAKMLHSLFG